MIGIYAHHHGSGHLHRCRTIAAHLAELGHPARILSSAPGADVPLPLDTADDPATEPDRDVDAHGTLHYVPLHRSGLTGRMGMIAEWIVRHRPAVMYVDVSVEVSLLARLMGVPVVGIAMPGRRDDPAHQLGYRQAVALIAAWPDWVPVPPSLAGVAGRVHPVGGITRFDGRTDHAPARQTEVAPPPGGGPLVVVLTGQGGSDWGPGDWEEVARACPDHRFLVLGGRNRVDDPFPHLRAADVVVAAAGQNSVADVACADVPAILLPQDRPFDEQHVTARVIGQAGLATVLDGFPAPERWPVLLEQARTRPSAWERWQTSGAAARAADVLATVAQEAGRGQ